MRPASCKQEVRRQYSRFGAQPCPQNQPKKLEQALEVIISRLERSLTAIFDGNCNEKAVAASGLRAPAVPNHSGHDPDKYHYEQQCKQPQPPWPMWRWRLGWRQMECEECFGRGVHSTPQHHQHGKASCEGGRPAAHERNQERFHRPNSISRGVRIRAPSQRARVLAAEGLAEWSDSAFGLLCPF